MAEFTAATLNLKLGELDWDLRAPWLLRQLVDLKPDVIGFQELDLRLDQGNWIRERFNIMLDEVMDHEPYVIHHMAKAGENVSREALGIMTNLKVSSHEGLDYLFRDRVAHRVRIEVEGTSVDIYNTHFHHMRGPENDAARVRQAEQLQTWISERSGSTPVVLVADLNSLPGSEPLRVLGEQMRSAYEVCHGEPPRNTLSPLAQLSMNAPGDRTLDHILVSEKIEVVSAQLAFTEESPSDPGVYASDHFGLVAWLNA